MIKRIGTALVAVPLFVPKSLEYNLSYGGRLFDYCSTLFIAMYLLYDLTYELEWIIILLRL